LLEPLGHGRVQLPLVSLQGQAVVAAPLDDLRRDLFLAAAGVGLSFRWPLSEKQSMSL
jgi:hypothetical protein